MNDFPFSEHVVVYTRDTCVFIVLRRFTKSRCLRVALARSSRRDSQVLPQAGPPSARCARAACTGLIARDSRCTDPPCAAATVFLSEKEYRRKMGGTDSRAFLSYRYTNSVYIYEIRTSGQIPLYIPFLERDQHIYLNKMMLSQRYTLFLGRRAVRRTRIITRRGTARSLTLARRAGISRMNLAVR